MRWRLCLRYHLCSSKFFFKFLLNFVRTITTDTRVSAMLVEVANKWLEFTMEVRMDVRIRIPLDIGKRFKLVVDAVKYFLCSEFLSNKWFLCRHCTFYMNIKNTYGRYVDIATNIRSREDNVSYIIDHASTRTSNGFVLFLYSWDLNSSGRGSLNSKVQ